MVEEAHFPNPPPGGSVNRGQLDCWRDLCERLISARFSFVLCLS